MPESPAEAREQPLDSETFRGLRVVLCVNSVEMGGVEEHVRQLGTGLTERSALVTAIVPEDPAIDPLARAVETVGIAVERLTLAQDMFSWSGVRRLVRMVRLLRAFRADILHLHLVGFNGGRWVLLAARLARVPTIVCTIHIAPRDRQSWRIRLDRSILSRFIDGYIAVSRASRERLVHYLGLSPRKVVVVPNAVELRRFAAPAEPRRRAVRVECGIPADAPVIGVLARLSSQKGLTHLVSAAPAIVAAFPQAHLLLVGDGPLREDLVAQARSLGVDHRIHFVGYRANTVDFLRAMDLFVLPSLYEGMPLSILEAMGAALPVVATAVDGTPEAVVDGETGYLVPPADPTALAVAVNRLLGDRDLAARMGRNGRARAQEHFSETALLDRLGLVYRAALRRHRPACA
jgi:glycosyltransferase involved in cell wall biosynthesis